MCSHMTLEPVELLTGETVALMCAKCFIAFPPNYRCPNCEKIEVNVAAFLDPIAVYTAQYCPEHAP
jgi:hypothetical protein